MPSNKRPAPKTNSVSTSYVSSAGESSQVTVARVNSKDYTESIITNMPIPLLVLTSGLRVYTASQAFYDTFHVTAEATEGQLIYELGNGQWNIPGLRVLLEEILPNNKVFSNYEVEHTFDEIGHCTMLLNGRQLDHVQFIQLVIVDITKRKQMEAELQKSYEYLQETLSQLRVAQAQLVHQARLAAVGELAAGIAHDFNNILSIIMLQVELGLRTPHQSEKLHKLLETIAQQSKRAAHMIQQLLDFGRSRALQTRPVDLAVLLTELTELLPTTRLRNIKVRLTYGSSIYIINADPTGIQRIFTNLIFNACDAMPDGGELRIDMEWFRLESQDAAPLPGMQVGEWIQVAVNDAGMGIAPEVMPHIFEPFFTTKDPDKGSGLGLAQVYGLVRQHLGFIDVRTREEEGTNFTIYLPALNLPT